MKKLLKILIPLLVIGLIVVGLGFLSILQIPGITPKKPEWQAKLKQIYTAKGSYTGETVKLKDAKPEEVKAFLAAAIKAKFEPTQIGTSEFKSKKLVEWLVKEAAAKETKAKSAVVKAPVKPAETPVVAKPTTDPKLGDAKLAALWEELGPDRLPPVIEKWKDADLAKIFAQMDESTVAGILAKMKPERASALSKAIQKEASIIPVKKEEI